MFDRHTYRPWLRGGLQAPETTRLGLEDRGGTGVPDATTYTRARMPDYLLVRPHEPQNGTGALGSLRAK